MVLEFFSDFVICLVLISPSWNVNPDAVKFIVGASIVLISPSWNVNVCPPISKASVPAGFNLTKLECKYVQTVIEIENKGCFNLTKLECKFGKGYSEDTDPESFNLTKLECKSRRIRKCFYSGDCFNLTKLECKLMAEYQLKYEFEVLISPSWNVNPQTDKRMQSVD